METSVCKNRTSEMKNDVTEYWKRTVTLGEVSKFFMSPDLYL